MMTKEELAKRRKRHQRVILLRRLIKYGIYALVAVAVFLLLFFGIRAITRRGKKAPEEAEKPVETQTDFIAGDTAVRKAMANPALGDPGWNIDDNGWWYKTADNARYANGWKTIDGQRYYFTEDGYMATGWISTEEDDYFFRESGVLDPDKHLKLVALTFDDGPSYNTDTILDVLNQYGAKATFFVVGEEAEVFREQLKREADLGMEIGNHTYNHQVLSYQDVDAELIRKELGDTNDLVEQVTGKRPTLMRPPGGGSNALVESTVDMPMINWDVDTLDWDTLDADSTYQKALYLVEDGSIILMHDLYEATAEAVKMIVPVLKAQGYKMVTITELAKRRGITMEPGVMYYDFYPEGVSTWVAPASIPDPELYMDRDVVFGSEEGGQDQQAETQEPEETEETEEETE